jgi:hypothetical protein
MGFLAGWLRVMVKPVPLHSLTDHLYNVKALGFSARVRALTSV